jgi:type II secretory pathway predicted ATPase ExeA
MLHKHFELNKIPFTPNPSAFFESETLNIGLVKLQTTIFSPQIALITGKIGSGKTILTTAFMDTLDPTEIKVIMTPVANPSPRSIFKNIATRAGLPPFMYGDDIKLQLINHFEEIRTQGKSVLVVLDECHTFSVDVLDQLKTFFDTKRNFSLILLGQPQITKTLRLTALLPLKQRISVFINTSTLSLKETRDYVDFRLKEAGASTSIFDEKTFPIIHQHSEGVYRMIDQLCFQALTIAYMNKCNIITTQTVESAYKNLDYDF